MAAAPVRLSLRSATPRAAAPSPPVRQYSFTNWQTSNPTAPPPGDKLDSEFDRADNAITDTINWAKTSLNTDGTIKSGIIGETQLQPGLFDDISADAAADLQPLVDQANSAAGNASASATAAAASASSAANSNTSAQGAASTATSQASAAANSAAQALVYKDTAQAAATAASNDANSTDGDAALCEDYGVLTQAWAEHMPDTIPANILATMDVTGDHWSSRWWANRAQQIVDDETHEAVCQLQKYWLGAYSAPPTEDLCGQPIVAGAMFWNLTEEVAQVYDGTDWHDITQLALGAAKEYLYLPAVPTTVFTGVDYHGNTLALDPVNSQVAVYLNGVRLLLGIDYSVSSTAVTMLLGPVSTPNSVEVVSLVDVSLQPPPSGIKINTNTWVFDGVTKTFPLRDSIGAAVTPPGSVDCLVSLNGVIQEAGGDFTISTSFINFIVAPEADADKWMVVGLPLGAGATMVAAAAGPAGPAGPAGRRGRVGRVGPSGDDDEELLERLELLEARVAVLERSLGMGPPV